MASGLMTDLYHPDAAYVSWRAGMNPVATFDLYTRSAPFGGAYLLTAGLEAALDFATGFAYSKSVLAFLAGVRDYDPAFLTELARTRFTGDVWAMPEGTVAFAHEPLLRVTAPFRAVLMLESGLLHAIGPATLIATKAARVVHAAGGRPVAEFGFRRAQSPLVAARSAAIGGCVSTSFLMAGSQLGLPVAGTIPHALIQLFGSDGDAFRAVADAFPRYSLLLDTYDVPRAVETAVDVARDARARTGHTLDAVRLDSGDLAGDSRLVRKTLDAAGLNDVRVLASGDLDEFSITALVAQQAPIDAFGVGTSIAVGNGNVQRGVGGGALGAVYKLVWVEGGPAPAAVKIAGAKSTWPGHKQVYRVGNYDHDLIALDHEPAPADSLPLLRLVMRAGAILPDATPTLEAIRTQASANLAFLPDKFHALMLTRHYPVEFSDALRALRHDAMQRTVGSGKA